MRALVLGATGQMGSYMVDLLREKDYEVIEHTGHFWQIEQEWHETTEANRFRSILLQEPVQEVYNFAALMFAPASWERPINYMSINGMAPIMMLDEIRRYSPSTKFFQAGSAEVFEKQSIQQWEDTNRLPDSPYGLSKMVAMEAVRIYRDQYKLFACTGIFFNAESPRRAQTFFAEKVVAEVLRLKSEIDAGGQVNGIELGRLDARRDWGWAPEYVEVAWKMMQQEKPYDYIIGTGEAHTCQEFVLEAMEAVGIEKPLEAFKKYVKYEKPMHPLGNCMRARPELAKRDLGWEAKYRFKEVIRMMVAAGLQNIKEQG